MPKTTSGTESTGPKAGRPFLGVRYECCGVYARIYREHDELHYEGRCPKCMRSLTVRVDPKNGTESRFLRAR